MGHKPRDGLEQRFEGYPAYGAVHDVIPNGRLRGFLTRFAALADDMFGQTLIEDGSDGEFDPAILDGLDADARQEAIDRYLANEYDPRQYYRIFDIETLGVSVVEMDPAQREARKLRAVWEGQDFGAVEQEARDEMGKKLPNMTPALVFNRVDGVGRRLPDVPKTDTRQKLALFPDSSRCLETISLIDDEADITIRAIRRRLKQFIYPWDVTPHMTFTVFRQKSEVKQIEDIIEATNRHLAKDPIKVYLGALDFRSKTERGKSRR